ncbi:hypothetical protein [Spiroplasma endosymbiont of Danaus chrysippus]|uniref:hypothetical protein n=1 Tax=Spiroplasma endosymbiont of Danaus chrysippus TaxID=2691041 RepID=UPI0013CB402F|nr:hypothetical protein [Spiroplasma endosymbiont of Danaus chrysippus]CAB1055252.1 hypothetical protein [Spiroplasma endosymbiont of Danaus chrysippus]
MKKKIRFFLNYILVSATIINVSACKWGCTNNDYDWSDETEQDISGDYIVPDINKRTRKIISDRLNFFGIDTSNVKNWYLTSSENWFNKSNKKWKFINNLEEKIKYKANEKSINDFDDLENNKDSFNDFNDLQTQINDTYLNTTKKVNINFEDLFQKINILTKYKNEIKNEILKFYNIFSKLYGKNNVLKLVYKIDYDQLLDKNYIAAQTKDLKFWKFEPNYGYYLNCTQMISLSNVVFSNETAIKNYIFGFWSSKNIVHSLVHEYGHALSNFLSLDLKGRQNINYFVDNQDTFQLDTYFCKSLQIPLNKSSQQLNSPEKYMISSLANGTKINAPIYQKLLSYAIVRSNYGRTSINELFAEGFAQWIETPENQRNIAWEKLDKFFRIDLPKIL